MKLSRFPKRIFLFPIILFITGLIFLGFSLFQHYFTEGFLYFFTREADNVGVVFILLSFLLLISHLSARGCDRYRNNAIEKNQKLLALVIPIFKQGLNVVFILLTIQIIVLIIGFSHIYLLAVNKIIYAILIASIGWIFLQILKVVEFVFYQHTITSTGADLWKSKANYTKIHIMKNILATAVVIIAIAAILMLFEGVRQIGVSLLASAGLLTAILGLASQKTLSSMFAGFQLAMTQPIKMEDGVIVENEYGTVEQINPTYVVVKLWDLRRVIVPINYFLDKPFQNWSRSGENLIGTVFLYVDYTLPIDPVRDELNKIVNASSLWDKKTLCLQVTDLKESSVEIRILVSSDNPNDLFQLRSDVREKLLSFIRENYPTGFPHQRVIKPN